MKKRVVQLFCLIMVVSMILGGCSQAAPSQGGNSANSEQSAPKQASEESSAVQNETLKLWVLPFGVGGGLDNDVWAENLSDFNEAKVDLQIIGWENYSEKLMTAISAKTGPDVAYMYTDIYADFIDMGAIASIDEYITQEDYDHFYYMEWGKKFGKMYGFPFIVGNPRVVYYNPKMLAEAGVAPPKTWDDFLQACITLTKDTNGDGTIDQWGYAAALGEKFYGTLITVFENYLWQNGGELFSEDGKTCTFDSPEGIEAATFVYDLLHTYKVMPESTTGMDENQVMQMFASGQVAFIIDPTTDVSNIKSLNPDFEWDYIPSLSKKTVGTFIAADQLAVMSACENKDAAVALIRHILKGDNMENFHTKLSAFAPIAADEPFLDQPEFEKMYTDAPPELFRLLPAVKNSFKVYDYTWKQFQSMMLGDLTPEAAMKEAARYGNEVLAE